MPAPQGKAALRPGSGHLDSPECISAASEPPLTAGSCVLRQPELAGILQESLLHFEGNRYRLRAWCIMPNHVHVVVKPLAGWTLKKVLHTWKSFAATKIGRALGRSGPLWERESFDHLIRRLEHVAKFVRYVERNPVEAGLCARPQDWSYSSCGAGFRPAPLAFVDPRRTPFVRMRSRTELPHLHKPAGIYFVTWRLLDAVQLNRR
jgi:REP element-mobilizing transposase RayT